jgi:hypothetical protein
MLECGGAEVHIEQQKKKHTIKVGRNISTEKKEKLSDSREENSLNVQKTIHTFLYFQQLQNHKFHNSTESE